MKNNNSEYMVIIAGGGTGGHLFPAIAIGEELRKDGIKIKYIGSKYGIESEYKFTKREDTFLLDLKGFQRSFDIKSILINLLLPYRIIKSYLKVKKIFKKHKPDFIIGTGGYSCAIPLYVAARNKILSAVQEQNVIPGLVAKKFSSKVDVVFTSFKETEEYLDNNKIILTGNPIRKNIKKLNQWESKAQLDLNQNKFTILIIGGSQGAKSINNHFLNNYEKYINNDIQIIWQVGSHSKQIKDKIDNPNIKVFEFIDDMGLVYSASDLIISRAGATAISEILYLGKPSILIPFPYAANNHQEVNASILENKGASKMIKEENLKEGDLERIIFELSKSENKINRFKKNATQCCINNSSILIKNHIKNFIENAN